MPEAPKAAPAMLAEMQDEGSVEDPGPENVGARRDHADLATWGLVAVLSAVGGLLIYRIVSLPSAHYNQAAAWPFVTAGIVVLGRLPVHLHLGRRTQSVDLVSVPILVGVVLLPPPELLIGAAIGLVLDAAITRHRLLFSAFNVAAFLVAICLSTGVFRAILGTSSPVSVRGWLAVAAAAVTLEAAQCLAVTAALACQQGPPDLGYLRQLGYQTALVAGINCAMVIVAVACYWSEPWALLVLLCPALIFGWWYRSSERLRSRFADLQSLYTFSRSLANVAERTDVLSVALKETKSVLHCDWAELCIVLPEGLVRYRLDSGPCVVEESVQMERPESTVLSTQTPLRLSPNSDDPYLKARGFKDAMLVPLSVRGDRSLLVVADRHGNESTTFTREDEEFFQTLAAHLSTALTASNHLDRLRRSIAEREHEAYHDSLTGLANRTLFMNVVAKALENSNGNRMVAVVLMDLDGFKEINDALGHQTGDEVLKVVATRVSSGVREYGMAARLGGDEFAFMVGSAESVDEIIAVTEEVMASVGQPMEIDQVNLTVRASVGIALAPVHGLDAASMLKKADVAMYSAKSSSRRINIYDRSMDNSSSRRLALATDLGKAIESNELDLWFQPVADIASGRVSGFEALLRWPHAALGYIPPDEFIPIAEQTGLIEPLTWWVVNVALGELRKWRDDGYEFDMAVNVSVRSLMDAAMVDRLRDIVASFDLAPNNITLEVTESSMMVELERAEAVLRRLSDLGFKIAIDDFGTGYSSLSRLKVLPVHVVKIDKAFVQNICFDKGDQAIVKSIIDLARVMGHQIVAEGIEDLQTWSRLASLGCDLGQGYYFAKPMLARDCRRWVLDRQGPSVASVRPLGLRRIEGA